MLVLDSDHITILERGTGAQYVRLRGRLERAADEEWCTTIVSFEEQTRGWLGYLSRARSLDALIEAYARLCRHLDIYRPMRVLPFNVSAAHEYERLRVAKLRVGSNDLKIGAIVRAHEATLLTRNVRDFERIDT